MRARDRMRSAAARRRGAVYVFVLSVSLLVTVIGIGGLYHVRVETMRSVAASEGVRARLLARSAIELGLLIIRTDDTWRTKLGAGTWIAMKKFGDGQLALDAALSPDPGGDPRKDLVTLEGRGIVGSATHRCSVTVECGSIIIESGWKQEVD